MRLGESGVERIIIRMQPKLLDLYCGAGGAGYGYHMAGFDVVGVDIIKQKHYPFEQINCDAIEYCKAHHEEYDSIHASPPCQAYTRARKLQGNKHPKLLEATRRALIETRKPYVIENVPGAPLINPTMLCGQMFEMELYRHRLFETNFNLDLILHPQHCVPQVKMGRMSKNGEYLQMVGHFAGVDLARKITGCHWMNQYELAQSIPPQYTEWIGKQMKAYV